MADLAIFLVIVVFFFGSITLIGHAIWLGLAWLFRLILDKPAPDTQLESLNLNRCVNCKALLHPLAPVCTACGWRKPSPATAELMKEIGAAHRQLQRLYRQGSIGETAYREMLRALELERERLASPTGHVRPSPPTATPTPEATRPTPAQEAKPKLHITQEARPPVSVPPESIIEAQPPATHTVSESREDARTPVEVLMTEPAFETAPAQSSPQGWAVDDEQRKPAAPAVRRPRKPLTEVLAAFMEQSNIRWGEIIGGLLIIGCSTALVISLWNEISRIPVLKFFIFTTVTAALFGVGLYTEHRWKLPTTSRGILTIATLLVPLNFLAIAAVSKGTAPAGALVVASELIAPALFLCLVYFAGRIITPAWPQLLAFGVLGSSVGQLLIRHFASAGMEPTRLVLLGFFPLLCFVAATGWMLRRAAREAEFDESQANTIFVTLGASTFAAILSLGLLSYKSGQTAQTLMQLAPLLTLGSGPILVSGLLLWQRIRSRELAASRTAGTSIALTGALLAIAGILLSFPNPASVFPAALLAFFIFTSVAQVFDQPRAHLFAAFCFTLAFIVTFLAWTGQVEWQSPRHTSLLSDLYSIRSGQAMAALFVLFIGASEFLSRRKEEAAGVYYMVAASVIGGACLVLVTRFGLGRAGDPYFVAPIYLILTAGAFFIAWRRSLSIASWVGSGVLLLGLAQTLGTLLHVRFPWQAALLAHASAASVAAIFCWRRGEPLRQALARPLNLSALVTSGGVIFAMNEAYRWEPTAMYAQRLLWLACIWLVLLWLNRLQLLFTAMQVALALTVLLTVKLGLQHSDWYAYLPNAWLHPWSLQIQGSVLVMFSLAWIALRLLVRRAVSKRHESDAVEHRDAVESPESVAAGDVPAARDEGLADVAWSYLNSAAPALDRVLMWSVLGGFVLMGIYGALNGLRLELATRGVVVPVWNLAGFPHQQAYGAGAWILLGLLLLSMLVGFWERRTYVYVLGALTALFVAVPLLAAGWETEFATASAWRWLAAVFLLALSLALWGRERIAGQLSTFGLSEIDGRAGDETGEVATSTRVLLLILTIVPAFALTTYPALKAIMYRPVHGPSAGLFYQLGDVVSYSLPLVLISLALIGHAVRERAAGYAFAASLLINLAVTVAQLLTIAAVGGSMNRVVLVQGVQLNIIALTGFALLWLATRGRWMLEATREQASRAEAYLKIQIGIGLVLNALLIVPLVLRLAARPSWAGIATVEAGNARGWLALVLSFLAAFWYVNAFKERLRAWLVFAAVGATGALIAFDVTRWQTGTWGGFHALLISSVVTAWLMLLAVKLPAFLQRGRAGQFSEPNGEQGREFLALDWRWKATFYASLGGAWTVLLALRASFDDPGRPWWPVGALVVMSALAAGLHWETLSRAYLYAAGILLNLAATIWFLTSWLFKGDVNAIFGFIDANVAALALPCIGWLWLELRARRSSESRRTAIPSFHHLAALAALAAMLYLLLVDLLFGLMYGSLHPLSWLEGLATFSAVSLMFACLWDRHARYAVAGLYLLGLVAAGRALCRLDLQPDMLAWAMMLFLAAYAILTGFIWKSREAFLNIADRLGIPKRTETVYPGLNWLGAFNASLAFIIVMVGFWSMINFASWPMRLAGAFAVGAQSFAFAMLARGEKRSLWQRVALLMLAVGAVYLGWSWLTPDLSGTWLNRAVVLMIVMFGMIALYSVGTDRAALRESGWTQAARSFIPWLAGTGALSLFFVLSTEVAQQNEFGGVHIKLPALVIVGATLIAASGMCIFFAVRPKHDPLELSESGRMKYVYVAEVLLALLFMHIRLTMPWLFSGFFERYWPLVIVFIAFVGVGISEVLRGQGVLVVARPVERTGALLPLLPVIGFWMVDSRVDYSMLLFVIGILYATLSILRRSFAFGILAALAGNGGLWHLLHQTTGYGFFKHPQLWLIPIALSVLVAAYLNRDRFTEEQMAGVRYVTLMIIYVSSTSDIFINGVAESPWLPLALAGLSLAGVLCGILLRVRAFLFLGVTFLLIAIISMIWYASDNLGWTWLWWVAGIVTGALIIFTFALFEKKRGEMLQVLEDLRGWQK
jgi:hypothetical protein